MGNPPLLVGLLINGVAYAAIFIAVAILVLRFTSEIVWRSFLVLFLFIAAGLYIVFALGAGESASWVAVEAVGVAVFGCTALPGLRGSWGWNVAEPDLVPDPLPPRDSQHRRVRRVRGWDRAQEGASRAGGGETLSFNLRPEEPVYVRGL